MRVLQIIDSLNAGGAERMAVNYANALAAKIEFSGLVTTRKEGVLKSQLNDNVSYFFLNKKKTFDFASIRLLKKIIIQNNIEILHVHGTSFFTAFLVKLICLKVKIVFHEHNGDRSNQSFFKNIPLFLSLFFFEKTLVVNKQIEKWYHSNGIKNASYFPNFASLENNNLERTELKGQAGKRIICLANLRHPKNHKVLISAFYKLNLQEKGWSLHFVGKNYNDLYSENLITLVTKFDIGDSVFLYDAKSDIENILSQITIGVLCSSHEGFPVTLLEYGLAKLPVICSDVGFCSELIQHENTGLLFKSNDEFDLMKQLNLLIEDESLRNQFGNNLNYLVYQNYSQENVIKQLLNIYNAINV